MAATVGAPLICIIQNSQLPLGPIKPCTVKAPTNLWVLLVAFLLTMDGNHVLDCYAASREAVDICRRGEGPVLIVAKTFRMGGHATHDEREARELFGDEVYAYWGQRDPIGMYEYWLQTVRGIHSDVLSAIENEALETIESAAREALSRRETRAPDPATQTEGVYA